MQGVDNPSERPDVAQRLRQGLALALHDVGSGRTELREAASGFAAQGDARGRLLASAALLLFIGIADDDYAGFDEAVESVMTRVGEAPGAAAGANGELDFNLDLDLGFGDIGGEPPDRKTITLQGFSAMTTTTTMVCPAGTTSNTFDQLRGWLRVNDPSLYGVSADGQTIEGNVTSVLGTTTVNSVWKFNPMRE